MTTTFVRCLLLVATVAVLLAACSASADTPPLAEPPPPTEQPGEEPPPEDDPLPSEPVATAPIVASWEPGAAPVDLGDGRTIGDCEGDIPALCVADGDTVLGLLEEFRHPAPRELLVDEEDLDHALRDFAAARIPEIEADRLEGCGADHVVLPDAPGSVTVGGTPGLRYGFVTMRGDELVEHVVTWATVREGELRLFVVHAASPDGCMASELTTFATDDLVTLLPVLDRVMAGTPLPA